MPRQDTTHRAGTDLNDVSNVTLSEQLLTRENQWHRKAKMWLRASASDWRAAGMVHVLSCITHQEEGNS